jgi:acetyltransferase-like isoleucine patch superfamily enzyme
LKLLSLCLRIKDRISAWCRTQAARETATLHRSARLISSGRVSNILGQRDAISIGANSVLGGDLRTYGHGGNIRIGEWVFIGSGTSIWSADRIVIGDRVLIAHNVTIIDNNSHPLDSELRFEQMKSILTVGHPRHGTGIESTPVIIGNNVWISYGVSILRGVTIGEGAVIGAGSMIKHDVEPWTVVAGNPAVVIRRLKKPSERAASGDASSPPPIVGDVRPVRLH